MDTFLNRFLKNTFEIPHSSHDAIFSMEGIRGFAVFLVFLVHYVTLSIPWLDKNNATYQFASLIHSMGNIGVDLFFVLSGFLIYGMLIRRAQPWSKYLKRRIQRIYPTFIAVFLIYLFLSQLFPEQSKIPDGTQGFIYIVQNFFLLPGLFDIKPIITVAWSLSYEFFYYLIIPILIQALQLRFWAMKQRVAFFIILSIALFFVFSVYSGHIRLMMFISGILLFEAVESKKFENKIPIGLPSLLLALVLTVVLDSYGAHGWWSYLMLFILFFLFCLDCFTGKGVAFNIFIYSPLRWLGNMSYSYYLIHGLSLKFFFLVLAFIYPPAGKESLIFWYILPMAFTFTLIPSSLLFIVVEKPLSLNKQ
jgi:exopolysaccharide production protein ExoZ